MLNKTSRQNIWKIMRPYVEVINKLVLIDINIKMNT